MGLIGGFLGRQVSNGGNYRPAMNRLIALPIAMIVLALAGCNTVRGFGEDISAMGRALSNSTGTTSEDR